MLARTDPIRILLLAVFAALAITSLLEESPTWDEPLHLAQGFRFLKTGDPSFVVGDHPPGVQALAAIPLLIAGRPLEPLPREDPRTWIQRSTAIGKFLAADQGATFRLFPWAKLVIVLLGVALGWILYEESRRSYGIAGARLTLALFAFDPNMIAHARLVTTDLGAAAGLWIMLAMLLRWARRPTVRGAVGVGLALGFALLAKLSALTIFPIAPVLVAILLLRRHGGTSFARVAGSTALALATAFFMIWAVHGFSVGKVQPSRIETSDSAVTSLMSASLDSWRVPAPEYVRGVRHQVRYAYEWGHPCYLHGEYGETGWPAYFPIAFAIKTPLATILIIFLALLSFVRVRPSREELALLVFVLLYFGFAVRGSLNLGYRHILPILPPLFLLSGRLLAVRKEVSESARQSEVAVASRPTTVSMSGRAKKLAIAVLAGLLVWLVVGTVRIHPHYLAYFNETIGGPRNGWKWLADASLDWGQDLPGLARWLREHDVHTVNLSYYGSVDPAFYGIRWLPISIPLPKTRSIPTRDEIPPGTYAISVTNLLEVGNAGQGPLVVFQSLEPVAIIGYSIFIYEVAPPASDKNDSEL